MKKGKPDTGGDPGNTTGGQATSSRARKRVPQSGATTSQDNQQPQFQGGFWPGRPQQWPPPAPPPNGPLRGWRDPNTVDPDQTGPIHIGLINHKLGATPTPAAGRTNQAGAHDMADLTSTENVINGLNKRIQVAQASEEQSLTQARVAQAGAIIGSDSRAMARVDGGRTAEDLNTEAMKAVRDAEAHAGAAAALMAVRGKLQQQQG